MVNKHQKSRTIILILATISMISIFPYLVLRITDTLITQFSLIDLVFGLILLLCELFFIVHTLGYTWNIFSSYKLEKMERSLLRKAKKFKQKRPSVAILVPVKDEPLDILKKTILMISKINYRNKHVYILDDSDKKENIAAVQWLRRKYGNKWISIFRRAKEERHGAKAGILNDILPKLKEKYIAVFDADQNPSPHFLTELIPLLESDPELVFVQTPQRYTNVKQNKLTRAAALEQAYFYEHICEGKGTKDAVVCCGTNFVMRKKPLLEIEGFDESSVTEDFATSLRMHKAGFRSYYYNHLLVFGKGPENLVSFFKQQNRWAQGNIKVLKETIKAFFSRPQAMPLIKWWEYFISGSWYLIGIVRLILILFPILYVLFGVPSLFTNIPLYLSVFIPYFIFSFLVQSVALGERGYKIRDIIRGLVLSYITYPVYAKGGLYALINKKVTFAKTPKEKLTTRYKHVKMQMITLALNMGVLLYGVYKITKGFADLALYMNIGWLFLHSLIFSGTFYFIKSGKEKNTHK